MMKKHLIAAAASLSLVCASPATAQNFDREDLGKLLIGLAAVAVIGAAIEENRNRDSSTRVHDNHSGGINRNNSWSDLGSRNDWSNHNSRNRHVLPRQCFRNVETRFGTQRMFGQRCLERNYRHVNSLPGRCAVRVYTDDGPRRGFDPLCLRERGYRAD
ncbi:hypothetical protein SLH49_20425 [Cognatiyoonia sp. IB215446]|nr:hypothetical protein [Cognatiyoonia sp. IB215446]